MEREDQQPLDLDNFEQLNVDNSQEQSEIYYQEDTNYYALIGDIGGTNFRLRLSKITYSQQDPSKIETLTQIKQIIYDAKWQKSFQDHIYHFISECNINKSRLRKILLAIRGVVINGECVTDYKGENEKQLKEEFSSEEYPCDVKFVNDTDGMAQSLVYQHLLSPDIYIQLRHTNTVQRNYSTPQTKILLTMGTGTGFAILNPYSANGKDNYEYTVQAGEIWASTLAADHTNELQAKASEYLFKKMKTRTTLTKFLKGPTLLSLYQFMHYTFPELYTGMEKKVKKELKDTSSSFAIGVQECVTYCAVNGIDPLCEKTIDFLIEILAYQLQNLALTILPYGGIYVGGGITNYLSEYIHKKQDYFMSHFLNHPCVSEQILEKIPIYIMKKNPTLDGLEAYLIHSLQNQQK